VVEILLKKLILRFLIASAMRGRQKYSRHLFIISLEFGFKIFNIIFVGTLNLQLPYKDMFLLNRRHMHLKQENEEQEEKEDFAWINVFRDGAIIPFRT